MAHCMVDPDEAYEEARDNKAGFNDWPQDTWRSIEKDPPELNTPILVTDGESVFFGRTEKYDDSPCTAFHGVNVEDGFTDSFWSDEPEEWEKLQWQPAPKYKPQKTADGMFRKLSYKRNDKLALKLEGCRSAKVCYYSERFRKAIAFNPTLTVDNETEIYVQAYYVDDVEQYTECVLGLWGDELDACARLIEEMEEDNG